MIDDTPVVKCDVADENDNTLPSLHGYILERQSNSEPNTLVKQPKQKLAHSNTLQHKKPSEHVQPSAKLTAHELAVLAAPINQNLAPSRLSIASNATWHYRDINEGVKYKNKLQKWTRSTRINCTTLWLGISVVIVVLTLVIIIPVLIVLNSKDSPAGTTPVAGNGTVSDG